MLSKEDNERVTKVGPGTQMGALMRRYWTPALLSSEITEPVCDGSPSTAEWTSKELSSVTWNSIVTSVW